MKVNRCFSSGHLYTKQTHDQVHNTIPWYKIRKLCFMCPEDIQYYSLQLLISSIHCNTLFCFMSNFAALAILINIVEGSDGGRFEIGVSTTFAFGFQIDQNERFSVCCNHSSLGLCH